jgi:hypothetical protein
MPKALTLHVIAAQDVACPPSLMLRGDAIANWITRASDGEISFNVIPHTSSQAGSDGVDAATLQLMFEEFVTSPLPGQMARNVALILVRNWVQRDRLNGLMFDYDGRDAVLGGFRSGGVPREACAIFLDPLSQRGDEFTSRAALHELGHVFNLIHDVGGGSFMATPTPGVGYLDRDATALARAGAGIAPDDRVHLPGLSNFDGSPPRLLDDKITAGRGRPGRRRRKRPALPHLRLSALVAKDRYLLGEIVTLQLELSVTRGTVTVPCQLDPGYDALRIWYETPIGERRLYRPFVRMCSAPANDVEMRSDTPMINNPRISVGRCGVVFDTPGKYRVWAEFAPPRSSIVLRTESDVEFEVFLPRREAERELSAALLRRDAARFLAQKGGALGRKSRRAFNDAVNRHGRHEATKHIRYALGRHFFRAHRYKAAREIVHGLKFRLPSLQEGLERLREAASAKQR